MTDDRGVKDTLAFMIERHDEQQLHWLAAVKELERAEELGVVVPVEFPRVADKERYAYQFWGLSDGTDAALGEWANRTAPDGSGHAFAYLNDPQPLGPEPAYAPGDPRLFGTGTTAKSRPAPMGRDNGEGVESGYAPIREQT